MKKVVIISFVFLMLMVQGVSAQSPNNMLDTVWTKYIPEGVYNVDFSANDEKIWSNNPNGLMIIDAKTGRTDSVINGFYMGLLSLDKSKSYKVIDGRIRELDMTTFQTIMEFDNVSLPVTTIYVTNDKYITARNLGGMGFSIWDIESGRYLDSMHLGMENKETRTTEAVREVLLTPDYKTLLVRMDKWINPIIPTGQQTIIRQHIKILNAKTKEVIKEIDSVGGLYLSKTGKYFVCRYTDNPKFKFRVFETATMKELFTNWGFPISFSDITFSDDDKYMAVSHNYSPGNIDIWDIQSKQNVYKYYSHGTGGGQSLYESCVFSSSKETICATSGPEIFMYRTPWITGINEPQNKIDATILYPNPTNGITTIEFHQTMPEITNINLFDINGRIVKPISNQFLDVGNQRIELNTIGLNSGTYFVKVENSHISFTFKLSLNN